MFGMKKRHVVRSVEERLAEAERKTEILRVKAEQKKLQQKVKELRLKK
jgi:hypothetical protein